MPCSGYWGTFDSGQLLEGRIDVMRSGFVILKECALREKVVIPQEAEEVAGVRCLRWIYENKTENYWKKDLLDQIFCWVSDRGLKLTGTGLWHFLQKKWSGGEEWLRYVLYFPVA